MLKTLLKEVKEYKKASILDTSHDAFGSSL